MDEFVGIEIDVIGGGAGGLYYIYTESGTKYFLDIDAGYIIRYGSENATNMRKDGIPNILVGISGCQIGRVFEMTLDGVTEEGFTNRVTTPVTRIVYLGTGEG